VQLLRADEVNHLTFGYVYYNLKGASGGETDVGFRILKRKRLCIKALVYLSVVCNDWKAVK